jgi:hypothetical protein
MAALKFAFSLRAASIFAVISGVNRPSAYKAKIMRERRRACRRANSKPVTAKANVAPT